MLASVGNTLYFHIMYISNYQEFSFVSFLVNQKQTKKQNKLCLFIHNCSMTIFVFPCLQNGEVLVTQQQLMVTAASRFRVTHPAVSHKEVGRASGKNLRIVKP